MIEKVGLGFFYARALKNCLSKRGARSLLRLLRGNNGSGSKGRHLSTAGSDGAALTVQWMVQLVSQSSELLSSEICILVIAQFLAVAEKNKRTQK